METGTMVIPFGKPVRVGNYKVWRSKMEVSVMPSDEDRRKVREESKGRKKAVGQTFDVEQVNVSNMDGSWQVKIPQTSSMYGTIVQAFGDSDVEARDKFLGMVFANISNICLINSEHLHDALFFLTEMMQFPYLLLSEEEMREKMRAGFNEWGGGKIEDMEGHIRKMCEYRRKLYELIERKKSRFIENYETCLRKQHEQGMEEDILNQGGVAEDAMDVLER